MSSARTGAASSAASAVAKAMVLVSCFMASFSCTEVSFLHGKLARRPLFEIGNFCRAFDGRHLAFARDQQRARNIALPRRIDLEAQAIGKTVKDPVFRQQQAGS